MPARGGARWPRAARRRGRRARLGSTRRGRSRGTGPRPGSRATRTGRSNRPRRETSGASPCSPARGQTRARTGGGPRPGSRPFRPRTPRWRASPAGGRVPGPRTRRPHRSSRGVRAWPRSVPCRAAGRARCSRASDVRRTTAGSKRSCRCARRRCAAGPRGSPVHASPPRARPRRRSRSRTRRGWHGACAGARRPRPGSPSRHVARPMALVQPTKARLSLR